MEEFSITTQQHNSVCGDMIVIYLKIGDDGTIQAYSHAGAPQMFTLAAASLLAEEIEGKHIDEVLTRDYGFMQELGFAVSPRRRRSAVSALLAVRNAIHTWKQDGVVDTYDEVLVS
jgi:nitrogen fixation NifU-like protein